MDDGAKKWAITQAWQAPGKWLRLEVVRHDGQNHLDVNVGGEVGRYELS